MHTYFDYSYYFAIFTSCKYYISLIYSLNIKIFNGHIGFHYMNAFLKSISNHILSYYKLGLKSILISGIVYITESTMCFKRIMHLSCQTRITWCSYCNLNCLFHHYMQLAKIEDNLGGNTIKIFSKDAMLP